VGEIEWSGTAFVFRSGGLAAETAKALGFVLFASGEEAEEIQVGLGAESFRAVAVVGEEASGKNAGRVQMVFGFKAV
jgi:hypothetical protein